jgi:hypothetical protein
MIKFYIYNYTKTMELDNSYIVLLDYLYRYEPINDEIEEKYWQLKNDIFKECFLSDKRLEIYELKKLEKRILEFYLLFENVDYKAIMEHRNPIMYINYLSHMKEKLIPKKSNASNASNASNESNT